MKPISFIKGHMGGNEIILLNGEEIPTGRDLEVALQVLYPPNIRGHEVGLLYPAKGNNHLKAKIVGGISKQFISMCGGLTQVLGKALITTNLRQEFDLSITYPSTTITLETEAGPVLITLKLDDTGAERVVTDMTAFVKECYYYGIESLDVFGVHVMRVGKFLVANADAIHQAYPDINLENTEPKTLHVLRNMQEEFNKLLEEMQSPLLAQQKLAVQIKNFLDNRISEEMSDRGFLSEHTRRWVESYNNILEKIQKALHGDKSVNLHLHKVSHSDISNKIRESVFQIKDTKKKKSKE